MSRFNAPFEIHVHGQVPLVAGVQMKQLATALKPMWQYAGADTLEAGAASAYEEEPGIVFNRQEGLLQLCWTVRGDEDFRQVLDEVCMNLNDIAAQGAALEVSFYDADFDEEEEDDGTEARDDFVVLFVGPTPAAIMQVQRDMLVQDVISVMERHFEATELQGVVAEVDKLFSQRFDALVSSLELGKPPRGLGGSGGHGGGRKPRHLH
ncbi:DUF6806 family protein [Curvibacter sp. APW13]|uniref:DUF6806 family protein n=1 Tax=Curvibacter sp. APW13 TaxID=3077236 RepID=UPI0028E071B2|nr:DUF6806 family protein [Curvibacter sp. APW13]MDT8991228.1 DUF6806 family protein [Curvibacter sp. APW13]